MIHIGIDPILFSLGSFSLSWHSLAMVVAIGIGVWLPARLVAKAGLSADTLYEMAFWAAPGGIIGARLVHGVDYWSSYLANPGANLAVCQGGLALWGGILGGPITAAIVHSIQGFGFGRYA